MTEIYICKDCGSMSWYESSTQHSSYSYWVNPKTLKIEETDENNDLFEDDVNRSCDTCNSEDLEEISIEDLDKGEFKQIAKMNDKQRLNWLKKYLTLIKLANSK